jgi:hypothetical protein
MAIQTVNLNRQPPPVRESDLRAVSAELQGAVSEVKALRIELKETNKKLDGLLGNRKVP